jgi:hypothetical protein
MISVACASSDCGMVSRLSRLRIEQELELGGLLHGHVRQLSDPENPVDVAGGAPMLVDHARPIRHQSPGLDEVAALIHSR